MSDWLLLGVGPKKPEGQEFYTHTQEEWEDIVMFVDRALFLDFPLNPVGPRSHLERREALKLASLIDAALADPVIYRRARGGRWWGDGDSVIASVRKFSTFLKSCGGFLVELRSGKPLDLEPAPATRPPTTS
jgi:hypothetical protein